MKWYENCSGDNEIAISSRVRLARNIDNIAFPEKASVQERKKVCALVKDALEKSGGKYNYISMENCPDIEKSVLLEDHLISREFAGTNREGSMLITDDDNIVSVMVNEEDHIRTQVIVGGFDLDFAYKTANELDDKISENVNYAFDKDLGYLTSCPTNLGTGMRASVMLHLPAMTACGQIRPLVTLMTKIGLTVRGLYGEGSEADGCIYQISNQITLGISEEDTLEKLKNAVKQITDKEKQLRENLFSGGGSEYEDSICRSYGIMKYARKMSAKEFIKLWSNVKLGSETGILKELKNTDLTKLFIEVMPAHIMQKYKDIESPDARDIKRAEIVREYFA